MTIDVVRSLCRTLPNVTEDIKWGHDLCFCVWGKMFTVVNLERPHSIAFKCTPDSFGELIERPGIIPAPYMARNMWVQEQELGDVLDRRELETLIRTSYDLVVARLPKSKREPQAKKEVARRVRSKAKPQPGPKARARAKGTPKAAARRRGR
jgi:predicted DNA-binding protein (MmcQ/YjbR family)